MTRQLYDTFRSEALDILVQDVEQFRTEIAELAAELPPAMREQLNILDDKAPALLDAAYRQLVPKLRKIQTNSRRAAFRSSLADTYLLEQTEAEHIAESLRDDRHQSLVEQFVGSHTQATHTHEAKQLRNLATSLLSDRSASELQELLQTYHAYRAFGDIATTCHVSYVDAHSSWRGRRAAKKHVRREQQTYGNTLKEHRENVVYRMTQISCMYGGIVEKILEYNLDPAQLVELAHRYDRNAAQSRKPSAKLASLQRLAAAASDTVIDASAARSMPLRQLAEQAHQATLILSDVIALSLIQREYLPSITREQEALALDYSRVRSKHSTLNIMNI